MALSPSPSPSIGRSLVQSMSPAELRAKEEAEQKAKLDQGKAINDEVSSSLVSYIRKQWDMMRMHRSSASGWNRRLLDAQRSFNREYDPGMLADIREFGGSEVYAGIVATKCRGATSLLREVYLETEKPWGLDPTPEPSLPEGIADAIEALVGAEMKAMEAQGVTPNPTEVQDRIDTLVEHALRAAKKQARIQAERAEEKIDDFLVEGGFYTALADFLVDLPIFPIACIKGPVVRIVNDVKWSKGPDGRNVAVQKNVAKMFWNRVSPFDLFFTPGVSDIADADVIEINRYTRSDLNAMIGVPGYDEEKVREALREYGPRGLREWLDPTDAERAKGENRENPNMNQSNIIECLEFHGNIQGSLLIDWGMTKDEVDDPDLDYFVQVWVVGQYCVKAQIHPSPRKRAPYFVTSFEKVPGTPVGNALPDILGDVADVCNSAIRHLVNNMAISSGPQVVINDSRLAPGHDNDSLFPWKRWHVQDDPFNNAQTTAQKPVDFFQPNSNAQELMGVYEKWSQMGDELSAIPRYITGSDRMGGAGRTASGLAMLMGNANKILKTVASNIDRDVLEPLIQMLYDFLMLTDKSGMFRGDENIRVRGVQVAVQKETNRQRQMELLQATNNPSDLAIMGPLGRGSLLRSVSEEVGLPGTDIIPPEDELKARLQEDAQAAQAAQAQAAAQAVQQNGEKSVTTPGNAPGGTAPAGANTDLGVPEGNSMRGMV